MNMQKQLAIIVDVDGTLAQHDPVNRSPYDHTKADKDTLRTEIKTLLELLNAGSNCLNDHGGGDIDFIVVTGRRQKFHELTYNWLVEHKVPFDCIYMRGDEDNRRDDVVKKAIYEEHIKDKYEVLFVLDDRQRVVDMWRKELGIPCLQVNYGDF